MRGHLAAALPALLLVSLACTPTGTLAQSEPGPVETADQPQARTKPANPKRWVPDVEGRGVAGAKRTLRTRGFRVVVHERSGGFLVRFARAGEVIEQHPGEFSRIREGRTVTIVVARPPAPQPLTGSSGTDDYGTDGYENPAPGDDGTPDCRPGQPPVWVGNNDPYGLDGDGDGWGCE